jgi:hypothetical protein
MNKLHACQFHIQTLMFLIGAIACTLALVQWAGIRLTITIAVLPSSLAVERILSTRSSVPRSRPPLLDSVPTLINLILCASLCAMAARFACSTGVPTILSPLPFAVFVSFLLAPALGATNPWLFAASISFGTFLLMNFYQLDLTCPAPLRPRFACLLGLTSVLSVLYFAMGCEGGLRFQGASYTLATASINLAILVILWTRWLGLRRQASKASALSFATLLHCWLFWFAFPYLGELP